jgi:hypothetical protein
MYYNMLFLSDHDGEEHFTIHNIDLFPMAFEASEKIALPLENSKVTPLPPKSLYLQSLLYEERALRLVTGVTDTATRSCPNLHNTFLQFAEKERPSATPANSPRGIDAYQIPFTHSSASAEEWAKYYPEWQLPGALPPTEKSAQTQKNSFAAIAPNKNNLHLALLKLQRQTAKEIQVFCDNGKSKGFYIFQNTITHFAKNPPAANLPQSYSTALKSLLKVNVMGNMLIIYSLSLNPALKSIMPPLQDSEMLIAGLSANIKVQWSTQYFSELKKRRPQTIAVLSQKTF